MEASALAKEIGSFISAHQGDRQVLSALGALKSAQSALNRIGSVKDSSNPSPGKQAAARAGSSGSSQFPPMKGAPVGG